ncbi:glycosyl transferase, group 1 [Candidatus Vecturithrix granuli]|uniref:Glycosyl transferase, group 1 n=1 Tax=Vecturithrix granuli TaxID=1499967 RepID=A0A081C004_VECG1|nr:glycosyl transferase, group 1 [Candidatus Vecturithrix granuli]
MNVLYDHQIFEKQQFGGISRYFYELWRHAEIVGFSAQIEIRYGKNAYLLETDEFRVSMQPFDDPWRVFLERTHVPVKKQLFRIKQHLVQEQQWKLRLKEKNRLAALERLTHATYDIFHPTYYDPYFLDTLKGRPFVLTVFDMIHEYFPEYFKLTDRVSENKYRLCQAAARIIAISEQTKRDLTTIFRINPDKIEVVHLANSLEPGYDAPNVELPETYVLFTGSRAIYKNFYFLVRSIAVILHKNNLKLVCSGKNFSAAEYQFFESLGVQHHIMHVAADDAMLAHLYQHAQAFVFPSLYEGFGIPVLEAFACGCPAILSNTSSLLEVGGDAAVYFEPKDLRSIQETIAKVISHEDVRRDLIARGYERVKLFSWETTARKTYDVYKKTLNEL